MDNKLIPEDELTELKSAEEVKEIANSAESILEEMSCAHLINTAVNTGIHFVVYQHVMSNELKHKLEELGYKVEADSTAADPNKQWIIKGF